MCTIRFTIIGSATLHYDTSDRSALASSVCCALRQKKARMVTATPPLSRFERVPIAVRLHGIGIPNH